MNPAIEPVIKSMKGLAFSGSVATKVLFADKGYRAHEFSGKNFKPLKEDTTITRIVALDGGNAEIAGAPNFSLHILRCACVAFDKNTRVKLNFKDRFDSYCLAQAVARDGKLMYDVDIFQKTADFPFTCKFSFDSMDASLGSGIFRAEITRACTAARRMLEWEFASYVLKHLHENDIVLIDGSLQAGMTGETGYSKRAHDAAEKSGAILCGLAKTSRLFTDAGTPAASAIFSLAKERVERAWDYHPVADINSESHRADMHFVKLHESSRHAFRFEIFIGQKDSANDAIAAIAKNSVDASFPGYPYALVAAHNAAKIRPEELTTERAIFISRAGADIRASEASVDAHGVLDRI